MVLTVYALEYLCYLAGRRAMPGWYETASVPKYALHDWMFNLVWILFFIPAAFFAVNWVGQRRLTPTAIGLFYGALSMPAVTAWSLFVHPIPVLTFLAAAASIGISIGFVATTPIEAKRRATGAVILPILWNLYASLLSFALASLSKPH